MSKRYTQAIHHYWISFLVITPLLSGLLAVQATHKLHWSWGVAATVTVTVGGVSFGLAAKPR